VSATTAQDGEITYKFIITEQTLTSYSKYYKKNKKMVCVVLALGMQYFFESEHQHLRLINSGTEQIMKAISLLKTMMR